MKQLTEKNEAGLSSQPGQHACQMISDLGRLAMSGRKCEATQLTLGRSKTTKLSFKLAFRSVIGLSFKLAFEVSFKIELRESINHLSCRISTTTSHDRSQYIAMKKLTEFPSLRTTSAGLSVALCKKQNE